MLGGSESMYCNVNAPPPRKRPQRKNIELKRMFIDQFFMAKIRPITLIVWVLRRVEKHAEKGQKNKK